MYLKKNMMCLVSILLVLLITLSGMPMAVFANASDPDAQTDTRITFTGDEVGFYKEDGTSEFGMLSLQDGSKYVLDGDTVKIYDIPSNKTVYDGIHWGFITDTELTKDVLALSSGCWQIEVSAENCGYGIPVAPEKTEVRGGGTTRTQY